MAIDFTKALHDLDGKPMRDEIAMAANGETHIGLTLGRAAAHALSASFEDERNLPGEQKFERGLLACKVRDDVAAELKSEQVALIKKVIAKLYGPLVVYRAYPLLDPQEKA